MQAVRKFLFDTSFDTEEEADAPENGATEAPSVYSREDLEAARRDAFAEGKAQGLREAEAAIEQQAAAAMKVIGERLDTCVGTLESTVNDIKRDATEFAVALVRKAMPGLARHRGFEEIGAAVRDCLEKVMSEPKVVIRVHDSLLDVLKQRVDGLAERAGYTGKVVLLADETLGEADCRVEWADGGLERETERLWHEIDQCIERFMAVLESESPRRAPSPLAAPAEDGHGPPTPAAAPRDGSESQTPNATTE